MTKIDHKKKKTKMSALTKNIVQNVQSVSKDR